MLRVILAALIMMMPLSHVHAASSDKAKAAIKQCETKYKSDATKRKDCIAKAKAAAKKADKKSAKEKKAQSKDVKKAKTVASSKANDAIVKRCTDKFPKDSKKRSTCIADAKKAKASDLKQAKPSAKPEKPKKQTKPATKPSTLPAKKDLKATNVNTASASDLALHLPGIGPTKAQAIVDYRKKNGKFKSAKDVEQVPGLGPASVEKMKKYLKF